MHSVWGRFQAQLAANRREALGPRWTAAEKRAHSALRGLGPCSSPSGANTCVRPHLPEQLHPKRPARGSAEADIGKPPAQRTPRSRSQPAAHSLAHRRHPPPPTPGSALSTHCLAGEPAVYWGEAPGGPWPRKPPAAWAHFLSRAINFSVTQRPLCLKSSDPSLLKPTVFVSKYSLPLRKHPKPAALITNCAQ